MDEVYTCTCGGQQFTIGDGGEITCPNCGMIYALIWLVNHLEPPEVFNRRIRE